jgi:hypothetical protein
MDDCQDFDQVVIDELVEEKNGRLILSCSNACAILQNHNVSLSKIGYYCDSNNIKIVKCQLGCF